MCRLLATSAEQREHAPAALLERQECGEHQQGGKALPDRVDGGVDEHRRHEQQHQRHAEEGQVAALIAQRTEVLARGHHHGAQHQGEQRGLVAGDAEPEFPQRNAQVDEAGFQPRLDRLAAQGLEEARVGQGVGADVGRAGADQPAPEHGDRGQQQHAQDAGTDGVRGAPRMQPQGDQVVHRVHDVAPSMRHRRTAAVRRCRDFRTRPKVRANRCSGNVTMPCRSSSSRASRPARCMAARSSLSPPAP